MTPDEVQTYDVRLFLDRAGRRKLPAVPESFKEIANVRIYGCRDIRVVLRRLVSIIMVGLI